ncbi:MAG: anti-sigma factor antagonist [Calditrichaeota bacterium]|nr:MAG: anti-sigma factor antagonist [Calditrichota bacterium]
MINVNVRSQGSTKIVAIEGEVDLYSSPQVRDTLLEVVQQQPPAVVVDLRGVSYMDSSGLATLIEALQMIEQHSGRLLLADIRPEVREVFELSRLDSVFRIYDSVEQALQSVNSHGTGL